MTRFANLGLAFARERSRSRLSRGTAVALAMIVVLLLLTPQVTGHHAGDFVLLPVLLFGTVELAFLAARQEPTRALLPQSPSIAPLFQRPPPIAVA